MDFSPFWAAVLGGLGASAWAVFTEKGRALAAWLWRPFGTRLQARRERRAAFRAMPSVLNGVREDVDSLRNDRDNRESRITKQYAALNEKMGAQQTILEDQNRVMAALGDALATTLSITRAAFDTSSVAGFVCDEDGNNILVNDAFAELAGVDRGDLMQQRWQGVVHPLDLDGHLQRFETAKRGHYEYTDEYTLMPRGKPHVRVRVHLRPHPPDIGPASRWVGTVMPLAAHE